ncbi:hypothetical protein C8R43DRAFT_1119747 [Mycena crocata]|nr:hypothetical protein C8R43DRAFT_1119747 [Mycena crocata]
MTAKFQPINTGYYGVDLLLTAMQKMPVELTSVPIELIDNIVQLSDRGDLLALARTNHLAHSVCLRWMYRTVSLRDDVRAIGFFKILVSNTEAAQCVRELYIRLESLDMSESHEIFDEMAHLHLPSLRDCTAPFSDSLAPFLQLHPQLVSLAVAVTKGPNAGIAYPAVMPVVHLPAVRDFSGPDIVAGALVPNSSATKVRIPVARLTSLNIVFDWDTALLPAIVQHAPNPRLLAIRNMLSPHDSAERDIFLLRLNDTVPAFKNLTSLYFLGSAIPPDFSSAALAREFHLVDDSDTLSLQDNST